MTNKTKKVIGVGAAIVAAIGILFSQPAPRLIAQDALSAGNTYYVALTGSDTNSGGIASPFKTFSKAAGVMVPGDTLYIRGGEYGAMTWGKSGGELSPIQLSAYPGESVVFSGGSRTITLSANHVRLTNINCTGSASECIIVTGDYNTISGGAVHDNQNFGIRLAQGADYNTIENVEAYLNCENNTNGSAGGWGAGIRSAQLSEGSIFRFNHVHNNWCEGLIMGSANSKVYGNVVSDNYSQNIYIGNTFNVEIYDNVVSASDPAFFRSGLPANGITSSEETISGIAGGRAANNHFYNNQVDGAKFGMGFTYSEVSPTGCADCVFEGNIILNARNACMKFIPGAKHQVIVRNNHCGTGQIVYSQADDFILVGNTFGSLTVTPGSPLAPTATRTRTNTPVLPSVTNSPTLTNTPVLDPSSTPSATITRTATNTRTPVPPSFTPTPSAIATSTALCVPALDVWVCDKKP